MTAQYDEEDYDCAVCGQHSCPCPLCHGDLLFYYGIFRTRPGAEDSDAVTCCECGGVVA